MAKRVTRSPRPVGTGRGGQVYVTIGPFLSKRRRQRSSTMPGGKDVLNYQAPHMRRAANHGERF